MNSEYDLAAGLKQRGIQFDEAFLAQVARADKLADVLVDLCRWFARLPAALKLARPVSKHA